MIELNDQVFAGEDELPDRCGWVWLFEGVVVAKEATEETTRRRRRRREESLTGAIEIKEVDGDGLTGCDGEAVPVRAIADVQSLVRPEVAVEVGGSVGAVVGA